MSRCGGLQRIAALVCLDWILIVIAVVFFLSHVLVPNFSEDPIVAAKKFFQVDSFVFELLAILAD